MAEAFGVVASGIAIAQVAGTTAGAVIKLKRLWEEVKNVPENIADLMEQIDCLDPALWEAEQHFVQNQLPPQLWNDTAAIRSAKYCRKALQKLTDTAEDLASQVNSRRKVVRGISCVKVILKKDCLRSLEQRLETAVGMLQLAQQGYLLTLVKLQPDIVACKVMSQLESIKRSSSLLGTDLEINNKKDEHGRIPANSEPWTIDVESPQRKRELTAWKGLSVFGHVDFASTQRGFVVDTQPPYWLAGMLRAWSFNVSKSYSGWKFKLRSYSIRPRGSLIFKMVALDNVQKLQEMFDLGEASPFDRSPGGSSILHFAVLSESIKVLRFLKDMRLDNIDCPNARNHIATDLYLPDPKDPKRILESASLMSSEIFIARDFDDCRDRCRCPIISNVEIFKKIQPITCPAHDITPLRSRLFNAWTFVTFATYLTFEVFKLILSPDLIEDLDDNNAPGLLHTIALAIPRFDIPLNKPEQWLGDEIESWINCVRSIVHKSNVHHLIYEFGKQLTPLMHMTLALILCRQKIVRKSRFPNVLHTGLRSWIFVLKRIGIDLVEYGREETRVLLTRYSARYIRIGSYSFIGLQFGPNVDDWSILLSEPTDEFAGDFWNLIENPVLNIPGAWYETDTEE